MSQDDPIDWAREFADDPDFLAIPEHQRPRVLQMLAAFEKTLERGVAAIYGDEPEQAAVPRPVLHPDLCPDAGGGRTGCRAVQRRASLLHRP